MTYEDAKACCHVRSAIVRLSDPTTRYWKNHPIPLDERVPAADKLATDWVEHDPREGSGPYKIIGETYDGVSVLAPAVPSSRFTEEQAREAIDAANGITARWVSVPADPTAKMLNAAQDACRAGAGMSWNGRSPQSLFNQAYRAMIAAAPEECKAQPTPVTSKDLEWAKDQVRDMMGVASRSAHPEDPLAGRHNFQLLREVERHGEQIRDALNRLALSSNPPPHQPTVARPGYEGEAIRADERDKIVALIRVIANRFEKGSASQNNHRALADAIENGDAFPPEGTKQ